MANVRPSNQKPTDIAHVPANLVAAQGHIAPGGLFDEHDIHSTVEFDPESKVEQMDHRRELVTYGLVCRKFSDPPNRQLFVGRRTRQGGEERLYDRLFVGWGGGVERQDYDGRDDPGWLDLAMLRELDEELDLELKEGDQVGLVYGGMICSDADEVSQDHLGVLYTVEVAGAAVAETDKHDGVWQEIPSNTDRLGNPDRDLRDRMVPPQWGGETAGWETWSRILLMPNSPETPQG